MMLDDTLTDREFADALRESNLKSVEGMGSAEPDLNVDGLGHSWISRLFALFQPNGPS